MITTVDPYYPPRSFDLADAIEAGRKLATVPAVLLGVDREGKPVLHYARIEDGGSPSLLLCGHAGDVLVGIRASVEAWYEGVRIPECWHIYGDMPAMSIIWPDMTLIIPVRVNSLPWPTPNAARAWACEFYDDMRGSWIYYPRSVPGKGCMPVSFHTVS